MVVYQRTNQINKDLSALSDLIDIIKDPKAFAAAQKAIRDELALTDQEAAKSEDARAIITQADAIQKGLDKGHDDLDAATQKLADDRAAFEQSKATEQARLEKFSAELDAREANIAIVKTAVEAGQKDLEAGQKRVDDQIKSEQARLDIDKAANDKAAVDNANQKEALGILKADLDKRAQKITLIEQAQAL